MLFSPKLRLSVALIGFSAFLFAQADGAIYVTFSYDGTDTIGVVSGSIVLPETMAANDSPNGGPTYLEGDAPALYVHISGSPSYDAYSGGAYGTVVFLSDPDQWSGTESFGFLFGTLYTDTNSVPGETYAPTGTFTWSNQNLEQVGVNALTSPTLVHTTSNGEEIFFVTVPEPGAAVLFAGSAALAAIGIRRRGEK